MLERLIHKSDFERLLQAPIRSRSAHFALHHLTEQAASAAGAREAHLAGELSTDVGESFREPVDISVGPVRFGVMVPKRHARRAVTRNLLKRQVRQAFVRHQFGLAPGLWLVRLRRMFALADFPSARSAALSEAARHELEGLLSKPPVPNAGPGPKTGRPAQAKRP